MSVINKKEFFLLWTKQTIKNLCTKFSSVHSSTLGREMLKHNKEYLTSSSFIQQYGDAKITSKLLTTPTFMLDFLAVHCNSEFFKQEEFNIN
jgi:hypothetical protein